MDSITKGKNHLAEIRRTLHLAFPVMVGQVAVFSMSFVDTVMAGRLPDKEISLAALAELGAGPEDVIRTRTFLKHREDWEGASRVHGEFFSDIRPASTMLAVDSMIDPDWLVETELEAVLGGG